MANIYDAMVAALREHWAAHAGASPRRIELTQKAFNALTDARKAVMSVGSYCPPSGWEAVFHGIPVSVVEGADCHVVDKNGQRTSLGIAPLYWDADGRQDRRHTPKSQGS